MPEMPGSPMSTSATSGRAPPMRASASSIVRWLPVQRYPGVASISVDEPFADLVAGLR